MKFLNQFLHLNPLRELELSFKGNQLKTNLKLINGNTSIFNQSLFDIGFNQGEFELNRFEGTTEIKELDLSPLHLI